MSTFFDIVCTRCETRMGFGDVRSEEACQQIVDNREQILMVCNATPAWEIEIDIHVAANGSVKPEWLRDHRSHTLAVMCEYESFDDLRKRLATGKSYRAYKP